MNTILILVNTIFIFFIASSVRAKSFNSYCLSEITNNIGAIENERKKSKQKSSIFNQYIKNVDDKLLQIRQKYELPELYDSRCSYFMRWLGECKFSTSIIYSPSLDRVFITGYSAMMFGLSHKVTYEVTKTNTKLLPENISKSKFLINDFPSLNGVLFISFKLNQILFYDGKQFSTVIDNSFFLYNSLKKEQENKTNKNTQRNFSLYNAQNRRVFLVNKNNIAFLWEIKPNLDLKKISIIENESKHYLNEFFLFPNNSEVWAIPQSRNKIFVESEIGLQNIISISKPYIIDRNHGIWQSNEDIIYFVLTNDSSKSKRYYAIAPKSLVESECIDVLDTDNPISIP